MKILKRTLVAFLLLIAIVIVGVVIFLWHLSHRALPDYNKELSLQGLHSPVDVYRDSFAIPHVFAQDEHDLYLAVGYLMAEDRLWQMDMLRRVTEGRLSEVFGEKYVDTDLLLRALRFGEKSEKILANSDEKSLEAIEAFASGVNQYIERNRKRLPPEFSILRYSPEAWKPVQTLNMIGYMAWDLKAGWNEILLSDVQKSLDSLRYKQLLPDLLRHQSVVYSSYSPVVHSDRNVPDLLLSSRLLQKLGADVLEGSNNWAISGFKSATGMPLLANDMHLGLNVPGIWYQMHQVVKGKLNVTGLLLPCTPLIICGHNDSIAWGMTNTYVDNLDFYEEKINPDDSGQYEFNGTWRNIDVKKVQIRISNGKQVGKLLRFTHRGPIVSTFKHMTGKVVSMHWAGDERSDEFQSIAGLNRANNWSDFTTALRTFTSISQNIVYADKKGNIGLYCAAGVPIRRRDIGLGMLPGQTDAYDWKGFVPFEELPHLFNPSSGFVASANNRTAFDNYPYHIGSWYPLPNRFERITGLLSAKSVLSVDDFISIQLDQYSKLAEKYMPVFLKALAGYSKISDIEQKALTLFRKWDYSMKGNESGAAIFETLYLHFIRCIYADELGSFFGSFNGVTSISRNAADQLIDLKVSPWFDDVNTPDTLETLNDDVICSFSKAVAELRHELGDDPRSWEWGKIHQLSLEHPLSQVKILDQVLKLSRGPFPVGGSFHTVSSFGYDAGKPFASNYGSSHRHIFDVGNWDNSLTVIPTGISGIPASKHYCDQTVLYIKGFYHTDFFTEDKVIKSARYHMTFKNVP